MPNYRVIWRIDVEAESAVAAAERAREVQRDPESIASLFEVVEYPTPGRQTDHSTPRIAVDIREVGLWLESGGRSPNDQALKVRLRELLGS